MYFIKCCLISYIDEQLLNEFQSYFYSLICEVKRCLLTGAVDIMLVSKLSYMRK